jgi:hypothetical protein
MNNQSTDAQEIDLGKVFNNFSNSIKNTIFKSLSFFVKNKIVVLSILLLGFGLGLYLDTKPSYKHEVILKPNFNTTDYLYAKVEQFNSFKTINDENVLENKYQLKKRKKIGTFEAEPINDIYRFLKDNESGYNFLKLMAEDGSIKKIIDEDVTSKNYEFHKITFTSSEMISREEVIEPFLKFINDDKHLNLIHKINLANSEKKLKTNDSIVKQIDLVFKKFGSQSSSGNISISGENIPIDNLIYIKEKMISENNYFDIVKEQSKLMINDHAVVLNIKDTKGLIGKHKILLPIVLLLGFIFLASIVSFYKKNKEKLSA